MYIQLHAGANETHDDEGWAAGAGPHYTPQHPEHGGGFPGIYSAANTNIEFLISFH